MKLLSALETGLAPGYTPEEVVRDAVEEHFDPTLLTFGNLGILYPGPSMERPRKGVADFLKDVESYNADPSHAKKIVGSLGLAKFILDEQQKGNQVIPEHYRGEIFLPNTILKNPKDGTYLLFRLGFCYPSWLLSPYFWNPDDTENDRWKFKARIRYAAANLILL